LPLPELPDAQNADFQRGLNIHRIADPLLCTASCSLTVGWRNALTNPEPIELRPLMERGRRVEIDCMLGSSPALTLF